MKRSLLYQMGSSETLEFETLVEEVQLAEKLGLDAIWCFPAAGGDGDFRDSAPSIWLSALASRTERIRLGWGLVGMTPPSHPPIRIAEQAAAIDLASDGRLDVAFLPDAELVHVDEGAWDEGVRMLVDMWDAPRFSWTSARFSVQPIDVVPKPAQQPHPPLWLAGWSASHATRAGEGGLAFLDISGATDETLVLNRDAYTEARAGADPDDLVSMGSYGIAVDFEPSPEGVERLIRWQDLGIDQVVVRAGPLDGGHVEACERIRFLASEDASVH
jgi:alkanesulfonate monooxygenase SsuD/methylene tetrahydromethanopterin reductase-like flavin-dependent oxidoreductase (luciferase family)